MGKRSREKKYRKKWVRTTSHKIVKQGSFITEFFGEKGNMISNQQTPEERAVFVSEIKKEYNNILESLQYEINILQGMIKAYDPLDLMYMAAQMLLDLWTEHKSGSEYDHEENYFLPALEYLQYLIARTDINKYRKPLNHESWKEIWKQLISVFELTNNYLLAKNIKISPSAIDKLQADLDIRRLVVRINRQPTFFTDYLKTSLEPYEYAIKKIYGASVKEIIEGLKQIDDYRKFGVMRRYQDVNNVRDIFLSKLKEKGYKIELAASREQIERTLAAISSKEFKTLYDEWREKIRLAYTPAIFEITDLTSLSKPFLSLLSVKPSESVLTELTGPDHDDLSPLSPSMLHDKPFLEVDKKFYTFYHSGFEDKIPEIIENDLFQKLPKQEIGMREKKSDRIANDSIDLLSSIISPDFVFRNLYYPNPRDTDNLTELDALLSVDDVLFLIEIKAGVFSKSANRGSKKSMKSKLSDLILEGHGQSERAEKYIKSSDQVAFFDNTGNHEICRIRQSRYRRIFQVIITREDLGWVGARIAILSTLDPSLTESYPWHISIDDLRTVSVLFKDDEVRFVHFLEQRLTAASKSKLNQLDEIEHIGLYNNISYYPDLPFFKKYESVSFGSINMRDIDYYFFELAAGNSPEIPTQYIPLKMKSFMKALRESRLRGRFEVGSLLFSLGKKGKDDFHEHIESIDSLSSKGEQGSFYLADTEISGSGLTITNAFDRGWEMELRRSAARMENSNFKRWLVVQLRNKSSYEISKIDLILPGRFPAEEIATEWAQFELENLLAIQKDKLERNSKCPCGSGKKYKKCHGTVVNY